jgi:hypothetical protein
MRSLVAISAVLGIACASSSVGSRDDGGESNGGADGGADAGGGGLPDAMPGVEVCDGVDNDGDQFVDEGGDELCGESPNANPQCNGLGGCRIGSCVDGWFDVNNQYGDGCECAAEETEFASGVCESAVMLGDFPDTNTSVMVTGNLLPVDDADWYRFRAVDTADSTCDAFHARVRVVDDLDGEFQVEVIRGDCTQAPFCPGATDVQWYTNYRSADSPPIGQCPCTGSPDSTTNLCQDETADFFVKVRRAPGRPLTCRSYTLEISNGMYAAP